ncbi:MAG: chromosome segregation protein SMC [Clostridiaceae bacterium]|nr:chromosome segregation protein SMC [Clostridiaceae bacterium]
MYLKSIEIQGFKSFSDRIVLQFNKGLTTVVGPNGSGKSNIADAVRWVLGEQSAKTLRGNKMEDVIFAGTQFRKPVGFAYVAITIDNSDGMLPIDYEEVTVSRRIYRSGESEYCLNKTQCRLKDIQELFMNTGVGKEGYSIIGQGRIDEILSNRSEERRLIFEEAAGITKYKARKKEAEKKLENTKQNILRINDILAELESQLGPLEQQAIKARKYIELSNELKGIEVSLFLDTIDKLKVRMEDIEGQIKIIKEQINEENQKIENIKDKNRNKNEYLEKRKNDLESLKQAVHRLETDIEKSSGHVRLCEEKINHLTSTNETFGNDISTIKERIKQIEVEISKKEKRLTQLNRDNEYFSALLKQSDDKLKEILARLDEGERLIEEAKQDIMDKQDILSDFKINLNNLKNNLENYREIQKRLKDDIRQSILEKDRENMKKEDLDASLREVRENINSSKNTLSELEQQRSEIQKVHDEQKRKLDQIRQGISSMQSKYRVLDDMINRMDGYSNSVKAIIKVSENGGLKGIHGALIQLITVDKRFETAIEVSLGGALQNIITEDEYAAKKAIEYLKQNRLGRVTFLPKTSIKPRTLDSNVLSKIKTMKGFEGVASDKVNCDKQYRDILLYLLGRTVIVDNMESGILMARHFNYSFRIVTLDGEILNSGGSMTGGGTGSRSTSLIGRNRIIRELKENIDKMSVQQQKVTGEIEQLEATINSIDANIEKERINLSDLELIRLRDESNIAQILENVRKLSAKIEMNKQQDIEIEKQMSDIKTESEQIIIQIKNTEEEIEQLKEKVQSHQTQNKDEQLKRDELHTDINDYRVSVNSIAESIENVKEQIEQLNFEKSTIVDNLSRREAEKERNIEKINNLHAEITGINKKIAALKEEKTGKELIIQGVSEEIQVVEEELSGMLDKVTEHNNTIIKLQEEQGRLDSRMAKMESELETIQNRLWDEYGLTYGNASDMRVEIQNVRATQSRINELKTEIRELGPVNVAAVEDFAKTKERFSFMKTQHDDLIESQEKLEQVIQNIVRVMKKQFVEQFELINKNFSMVFQELFGGGFAEVQLADTENVLESGIDIIVQPPGKKLQNMMLLSGGERAMVAIALIFAILKMRPAPFYILDEIEASLDDSNVYRFADFIKRYKDQLQFIVITHRKGTMEAADILYGVTMEEHGVSKVISMKMDDDIHKANAV